MTKRERFFVALFNSVVFGILFTIVGSLFSRQPFNFTQSTIQALAGIVIGVLVGFFIPAGNWGETLAAKVAQPGSLLFRLVMYSVLMAILLVFMCPTLTVFMGCVLGGAPLKNVLPGSYALFFPFFAVGLLALMLIGDFVINTALKCAHSGKSQSSE